MAGEDCEKAREKLVVVLVVVMERREDLVRAALVVNIFKWRGGEGREEEPRRALLAPPHRQTSVLLTLSREMPGCLKNPASLHVMSPAPMLAEALDRSW